MHGTTRSDRPPAVPPGQLRSIFPNLARDCHLGSPTLVDRAPESGARPPSPRLASLGRETRGVYAPLRLVAVGAGLPTGPRAGTEPPPLPDLGERLVGSGGRRLRRGSDLILPDWIILIAANPASAANDFHELHEGVSCLVALHGPHLTATRTRTRRAGALVAFGDSPAAPGMANRRRRVARIRRTSFCPTNRTSPIRY